MNKTFAAIMAPVSVGMVAVAGLIVWQYGHIHAQTRVTVDMQTVNPKLVAQIENETVYTANGMVVPFPTDRPVLFTAWWCPHCHDALQQLKTDGLHTTFNLVSVFVNDGATSGTVQTWKQALTLTEDGLHNSDLSIPSSHIYLVMPNSPINTQIHGVPTLWTFRKSGVMEVVGTPTVGSVWKSVL